MNPHLRLFLTASAFGLATIPFYLFNPDLGVQAVLHEQAKGWKFAYHPIVMFFYKYGTLPGLLAAIVSSAAFALGFAYEKFLKYRKLSLIILLTILLGPGLLVNVIFKNYFGRPRPRDVTEFGGKWQHKPPLIPGKPGQGHSFPSGHASMGFIFLALYVYYRDKNKAASYGWLAGSAVLGCVIGAARMAQGGHFLSDVMWAGGLTLLSAEAVNAYVLPRIGAQSTAGRSKTGAYVILGGLCLSAALFFMMATPYYQENTVNLKAGAGKFGFTADSGDLTVKKADVAAPVIKFEIHGFGFPGSKVKMEEKEGNYNFKNTGLFTELRAVYTVLLPSAEGPADIDAALGKGTAVMSIPGYVNTFKAFVADGDMDAALSMKRAGAVSMLSKNGDVTLNLTGDFGVLDRAVINVFAPRGAVEFNNLSKEFAHINEKAGEISGTKNVIYRSAVKGSPELNMNAGRGITINAGYSAEEKNKAAVK